MKSTNSESAPRQICNLFCQNATPLPDNHSLSTKERLPSRMQLQFKKECGSWVVEEQTEPEQETVGLALCSFNLLSRGSSGELVENHFGARTVFPDSCPYGQTAAG